MNNLNLGIGMGSFVVNVMRMILLAAMPNNTTTGAEIYFFIAGAYMLFCTALAFRFISQFEQH